MTYLKVSAASASPAVAQARSAQNVSALEDSRHDAKELYAINIKKLGKNKIYAQVIGLLDYPRLRDPGYIRLLHLKPPHLETPHLRGSLKVHKRDAHCEYEALSYAWGDYPNSDKFILLDNGLLKITDNLYAALAAYSYPDRTRVLWVDAICINQADSSEKAQQISIMSDIYSKAQIVQVWLAPSSEFTSDAMRFMAMLSLRGKSLGISDEVDQPQWCPESLPSVNISDSDAQSLIRDAIEAHVDNLLARSWFRRVWIVQELMLAARVVVSCGYSRMTWTNFARAVEALRGAFRKVSRGEERSRMESIKTARELVWLRGLFRLLDEHSSRSHHVMARLFVPLMSSNDCSDDHDRVYAMLALMQSPYTVTPDYELTVAETYTVFARSYSPNTQIYLAGLCRRQSSYTGLKNTCANSTRGQQLPIDISDRDYLPSWVPEFRPLRGHAWMSIFDGNYNTATATPINFLSHPAIPNAMYATGTIFDIIEEVSFEFEKDRQRDCLFDPGFFFPIIEQLQEMPCISSERSDQPASEPLWLALVKTLTCGLGDDDDQKCIIRRYSQFDSLKHLKDGSLPWLTAIWKCFTRHCILPTGEVYQHMLLRALCARPGKKCSTNDTETLKEFSTDGTIAFGFYNYLVNILVPNRLFVTVDGYLGLAPSITRGGDAVAIFNGCPMPYVVRCAGIVKYRGEEIKNALQVIGPCYLHGIMKGEIVEKRDSPEFANLKWTRVEPDPVDSLEGWLMLV